MKEKNKNEYNAEMTINEYLSLLQIKYDCETVYITSVAKDRKAPSGGKSRTREADDAAIFA